LHGRDRAIDAQLLHAVRQQLYFPTVGRASSRSCCSASRPNASSHRDRANPRSFFGVEPGSTTRQNGTTSYFPGSVRRLASPCTAHRSLARAERTRSRATASPCRSSFADFGRSAVPPH
jgi:hypothetical protein